MYLDGKNNLFYVYEPFGSRTKTRKSTYIIRTNHVRETGTQCLPNTLAVPRLYVTSTGFGFKYRIIYREHNH